MLSELIPQWSLPLSLNIPANKKNGNVIKTVTTNVTAKTYHANLFDKLAYVIGLRTLSKRSTAPHNKKLLTKVEESALMKQ
ncbi:unnamed protein product [Trichobilharzia szidati]|nr:unnamed protein product [Trichobilharzia szidati]